MIPAPTVFVVDDDAFMRDILRRIFVAAGMDVQTFASGAELIERADLRAPALLLLDVKMPGMSGLELQAVLHGLGNGVPVMFLTGASDLPMAVAAMRNGAVDFMEKPFDHDALIERVRQALNRPARPQSPVQRTPPAAYTTRAASLTPREHAVLDLMVTGMSSKLIARQLGGSFRTIDIHRARVMGKMAVANLAELVRLCVAAP